MTDVPLFKVRSFNKYDGWYDVYGPLPLDLCESFIKVNNLSVVEDYEKGYSRIFPAETRMLNWGFETW